MQSKPARSLPRFHPIVVLLLCLATFGGLVTRITANAQEQEAAGQAIEPQEPSAGIAGPEYNRDIRPILADHCFACHGSDAESREADLRLDDRQAAIDGGALSPGSSLESELIARVLSDDPDAVMPPPATKKPLTDHQKTLLKQWVDSGAEYEVHWSFQPLRRPELPTVQNASWPKNAIDHFVLARLEAAGLAPAAEADPRTLFRRLHLDLTGLPPAVDQVERFVNEYGQEGDVALGRWIDQLMATTAWGEHRGRYWLDAARYGDTHGLHFDNYREMWIYRDWVIRSFNRNQPFDEFTIEQLAGDLLPDPTEQQLIATGFQRCNITTNEGGTIDEENLANYAADRVQTFGWVYLGMTTNCCQCHDHKFDPLSMKDYYSLAAYFRNTTQPAKDGNVKDGRGPSIVVPSETDRTRWESLPAEIAAAIKKRDLRKKEGKADYEVWVAQATSDTLAERLPRDDLVVDLPMNEGEGRQLSGVIGSESAITAGGDLKWTAEGKTGPAPEIDAASKIELGQVGDFERDQPFSYGVWVKTAKKNSQVAIIARMDEAASHRGWDLWQNGESFAAHLIDAWPDNAIKVATKKKVVRPGVWQHVMVTYDGSAKPDGVKIYVDGKWEPHRVEKNTLKADASFRTLTPLRVGRRSGGALFEGGSVQQVRVHGRALSAAEVRSISSFADLRSLLAIPVDQRTPQQTDELFDYFLETVDTEYPSLDAAVTTLEGEREAIRGRSPVTHVQQERSDQKAMAHLLMRGAYDRPGDQVEAAPPEWLHPLPAGAPNNRMGLAKWVVDPANPLTPRVTVNRFWQELFGQGIVTTPEDFGVMGAPPTHPQLLDRLASDFRDGGWDVKELFKQMMMSATYRQAAVTTPLKREKDRDNGLFSRGPRFRMDAEMVRDYALSVSGLLSPKMFGPGTKPYQPEGIWDIVGLPGGDTRNYVQDQGENLYRRSLYNFWKRMAPPPSLETLNAPSREVCVVRRERTNTPLQALVTLNGPQFVEAARHLAQLAMVDGGDEGSRLSFIAGRLLSRSLSAEEQAILSESMVELKAYYANHPEDSDSLLRVGDSEPDGKLEPAELASWTMLVNQMMNLDEVLNK